MNDSSILLGSEKLGSVLRLCMTSPRNRNALSPALKVELWAEVSRFVGDPKLRCLVLTGYDDMFCSGGDLQSMATDTSTVGVRERIALTHSIIKAISICEKPVVTAVNGPAIGAGFSLALMGDVVLAREDSYFLSAFPRVGVLPDLGLLYTLPKAVGRATAADLVMTNRRIEPPEALARGLVSRVLATTGFDQAVLDIATQIAEGPAVSLGLSKRLMAESFSDSFEEFLLKESMAQAIVFGTNDFREGLDAYADKRPANFVGR